MKAPNAKPPQLSSVPTALLTLRVPEAWIDENGHMNVAHYVTAADQAFDRFLEGIGLDGNYRAREGGSIFALESHTRFLREVRAGEYLTVFFRLLGFDTKRLHTFLELRREPEGELAATIEWLSLHVDLARRRACPFPPGIARKLEELAKGHRTLPRPEGAGQGISLSRRKPG